MGKERGRVVAVDVMDVRKKQLFQKLEQLRKHGRVCVCFRPCRLGRISHNASARRIKKLELHGSMHLPPVCMTGRSAGRRVERA
jgi:hypothetical protein